MTKAEEYAEAKRKWARSGEPIGFEVSNICEVSGSDGYGNYTDEARCFYADGSVMYINRDRWGSYTDFYPSRDAFLAAYPRKKVARELMKRIIDRRSGCDRRESK